MAASTMVAVQATDPRFLVLTHQPDGIGFNANGTAIWPADQFTFSMIRDGIVRLVDSPALIPALAPVLASDMIPTLRGGFTVDQLVSYLRTAGLGSGSSSGSTDTTPPVITTAASQTVLENAAFALVLTANEAVTWTKTGGADASLFTLAGATLSLPAQDYETPADADRDNGYVVILTATDAAGNSSQLVLTLHVADVAEAVAPANLILPTITGAAQVGQTLTASTGTWANNPTGFAYQWKRNGSPITLNGAATTYAPVAADVGAVLTVTVTASNTAGSLAATSLGTAAVLAANPVLASPLLPAKATFASDAPAGTVIWVPANKTAGSTITVTPNDGRLAVDNAGRVVVGLSASSVGSTTYSVTETLAGASNSPQTSPLTVPVTQAVANAYATRPVVTGTPMSSEVLSASIGNLGAGAGQWARSGTAVPGATASTYALTDADIGGTLTYRFTPSGGAMVESAPTDAVQQANVLTDAAGNALVDASGNALTLGYNFAFNPVTDAAGNVLTDAAGNALCLLAAAPVQQQVRALVPASATANTFNQSTLATQPITVAVADADRVVQAAAGVPFQVYAPNMARVEVWAGGAAIAALVGSDALGYFRGTLDLSGYANGPRWFEVRAYDKSTVGGSAVSIFAGFHLFLTGGKNANTSALPTGAAGLALKFRDDFTSLSISRSATNDGSRWYDQMPDNKNFGDQIFTAASSAQNPFSCQGSFLRIRLAYDANFAGGTSGLKHWFGGLLSSAFPDGTTNLPAGDGYYEIRALLPFGSGTWPAFWTQNIDKIKDTAKTYSARESDIIEQYGPNMVGFTTSQHRYAAATYADTQTYARISTVDVRWEFHRIGMRQDSKNNLIQIYVDDVLVATDTYFKTTAVNDNQNFILLNLALTPGPTNAPETVPPGSYHDMFVDSVSFYEAAA